MSTEHVARSGIHEGCRGNPTPGTSGQGGGKLEEPFERCRFSRNSCRECTYPVVPRGSGDARDRTRGTRRRVSVHEADRPAASEPRVSRGNRSCRRVVREHPAPLVQSARAVASTSWGPPVWERIGRGGRARRGSRAACGHSGVLCLVAAGSGRRGARAVPPSSLSHPGKFLASIEGGCHGARRPQETGVMAVSGASIGDREAGNLQAFSSACVG